MYSFSSSSSFSSSIPAQEEEACGPSYANEASGSPEMATKSAVRRYSTKKGLSNPRAKRRLHFEADQQSREQIRPRDEVFRDLASVLRGVLAVKQEKSKKRLHSMDEIASSRKAFKQGKGFNPENEVIKAKRRLHLADDEESWQNFKKCSKLLDAELVNEPSGHRFEKYSKNLVEERVNESMDESFKKNCEVLIEEHLSDPISKNIRNCIKSLGEEHENERTIKDLASLECPRVEDHGNPEKIDHKSSGNEYKGPYPNFSRPSSEECREIRDRLFELHGFVEEFAKYKPRLNETCMEAASTRRQILSSDQTTGIESVKANEFARTDSGAEEKESEIIRTGSPSKVQETMLDSLISILLSQNTTDSNSRRAFASLKATFPSWEDVHKADLKALEDAIRCGGLAETKAARIRNILDTLWKEQGKICLEHLRNMPANKIKAELCRFKGVGPKTVACVLMFHLHQDDFPVDTHVFRITKSLGWVPAEADREKAYLHLNHCIPNELKFDLNCLLVTHGKRCPSCSKRGRAQQTPDGPCPLWKSDCKQLPRPKISACTNKLLNCR